MNGKTRDGSMFERSRRIAEQVEEENGEAAGAERHRQAEGEEESEPAEEERGSATGSGARGPCAQAVPDGRLDVAMMRRAREKSTFTSEPLQDDHAAPIGIASFTGQYWIPHSVKECSPTPIASHGESQPVIRTSCTVKRKKKTEVMTSAIARPRAEKSTIDDVDTDVGLVAIGVGAG